MNKEINLTPLKRWAREQEERKNRGLIEFRKKPKKLQDRLYKTKVKRIIERYGQLIENFDESVHGISEAITGLEKGIIGVNIELYEVPQKGVIIYQDFNSIGYLAFNVRLLGFDDNDFTYKKIKSQLEKIAKKGDSLK